MNIGIKKLNTLAFVFAVFIISQYSLAQEDDNLGTEVVNVVKPYTPEIGDAFKVKATPQLNDSINTVKKPVEYGINSVPVASTFTPEKGRAADVERSKPVKLYDNYVTLGFGTYESILAEFYTNFEVSRDENFGIYLNHNSSQGGIDDVELDNSFYDTDLNLNYSSQDRDLNWRADLDLMHQFYNRYGVDEMTAQNETTLQTIDPGHSFYGAGISGALELEDSFFEGGKAHIKYFGDNYQSSEIRAIVKPSFTIPITEENLGIDLQLDYVTGSFDRNYLTSEDITYSHLNVSANPSLQILREDLTLDLGVTGALNLDTENSETNIYIYPSVTASYRVVDEYFITYAGLEGDLNQNTYQDFVTENPFMSPTLRIKPTDKQYDGYLGIKGKLSTNLSYNLRGSYSAENSKALFKNNPRYDATGGSLGNENYQYGNSFNVVYDDVQTTSIFGELNFELNNVKLRANAEYFNYDTEFEAQPWNLPELKASLFADVQVDEHWYGGAGLFFVGERKDEFNIIGPAQNDGFRQEITLDSFFDANAHLGYRFNDQLSAFARVNNIVGNSYQRWLNYPVQGIQVLAGATYKFDW